MESIRGRPCLAYGTAPARQAGATGIRIVNEQSRPTAWRGSDTEHGILIDMRIYTGMGSGFQDRDLGQSVAVEKVAGGVFQGQGENGMREERFLAPFH